MGSQGNLVHACNSMFLVPNIAKHHITGGAIEELSKIFDLLEYKEAKMQILRRVPKTSLRRWTPLAKDCYARGCNCQGCFYNNLFQTVPQCRMKAAVLGLVRGFGRPDGTEIKGVLDVN